METFDYKKWTFIAGMVALFAAAFAAVVIGLTTWKTSNLPAGQVPTITVSGEGEVTAAPDIATVSFTIRESAKTVPEAQKLVEEKTTKVLAELSALSIEKKDTKTVSYTVNPKYEYVSVPQGGAMYPGASNQKIVGYEVAQTMEVKVRNVGGAGDVIGAIGNTNITEIYGPNFTLDDPEKATAEAKEKAIKQAEEKAKNIAKSLGVSLGSIVAYNEDNGGYYPMYYARDAMMSSSVGKGGAAPEVSLPTGENVIKVRVNVTYSLR